MQHFIPRILKCSINSNNHVRACVLLTESKTETVWVIYGHMQLDHWNRSSGLFTIVFSSNWLWLKVNHREAEEQPQELLTHSLMCLATGSQPSSDISVIIAKAVMYKELKNKQTNSLHLLVCIVKSLCICCALSFPARISSPVFLIMYLSPQSLVGSAGLRFRASSL